MPAAKRRRFSVYVGWDPREIEAYDVCAFSLYRRSSQPFSLRPVKLRALQAAGWYTRETGQRDGRLWDTVSDAPMSTEFAISRFLCLCWPATTAIGRIGLCSVTVMVLWLDDIAKLIDAAHDSKALMCVQHDHEPPEGLKMDGLMQLRIEHFQAKWPPVRVKKMRQNKDLEHFCDSMKRRNALEHFQAKWTPVRVKKMRQNKDLEHFCDSMKRRNALAAKTGRA